VAMPAAGSSTRAEVLGGSRVYVPQSLWPDVRDRVGGDDARHAMGDVRTSARSSAR
jgi:hypothetical protein